MVDRSAISDLFATYAWGNHVRDTELLGSLFSADASFSLSIAGEQAIEPLSSREAIVAFFGEALGAQTDQRRHATQISCFGMTESCGSICLGDPGDSLWSRTHTSGRPLPGVEIRVVDPDSGEGVPAGEHGELLFRSITQFSGYYGDEEATATAVDEGGWVRTGDLVRESEDGDVTLVSRGKDMLKVGGENVSAADIEGYLISHPAVAIASVVGVADARYGEVPAAFVRLAPGEEASEEELIEFCLGQIATYKVPRYVRMVEEFPATPTEKIQKFVLRERIEAELRERGIAEAPRLGPPRQLGT